jgi:hypothetical protein
MSSKNRNPLYTSAPWRALRKWWAQQLPLPCARCGQPVLPGTPWDLDHTDDTARPSHRVCNQRAGQAIKGHNRHTASLEGKDVPVVSRDW